MRKKNILWKTYFTNGQKQFYKDDYKESIKTFTNGLKKTKKYKSIFFLSRAKSYFELGEYKKALYDFKKTLDVEFDFDDGYLSYQGSLIVLISQYFYDLEIYENNFIIDCLETFSELILEEKKILLKTNLNKPNKELLDKEDYLHNIYWCKALLHEKYKNFEQALIDIKKAIKFLKSKDHYDWLLADKARFYLLKGNYLLALKDLNSSIRISKIEHQLSHSYRSYMCASLIYEFFQDFNMVESMINMVIKKIEEKGLINVYPGDISVAFIKRAYINMTKGYIEKSLDDFGIAIENDDDWFIRNRKIIEKIPDSIKNLVRVKYQITLN